MPIPEFTGTASGPPPGRVPIAFLSEFRTDLPPYGAEEGRAGEKISSPNPPILRNPGQSCQTDPQTQKRAYNLRSHTRIADSSRRSKVGQIYAASE